MKELVGPYRIQSLLGHGGMGIVYLGVHDHLGREVAIKALAPELTQHPQFRERFFTEARVQAKLQHTNIVTIYDLIEDEGSFFIVMEYVPGPTLETLLKEGGTKDGWAVGRSLALFRQVLAGLDYAHSKGVIHRDVKSSNVLVTDDDQVKLTDFGIALLIGDKRLTASQSTIGTPIYMSPEQILHPRSVDHRSDVYSAAIVLYEILAGLPPFDADTEYEIKKLQIEAAVPDLRAANPRVPAVVAEAVSIALRKDPDERFQSAGAFLRALRAEEVVAPTLVAVPSEPQPIAPGALKTESTPTSPSTSLLLSSRKRWVLATAAVLCAGLLLSFLLFQRTQDSAGPEPEAKPRAVPTETAAAPIQTAEAPLGETAPGSLSSQLASHDEEPSLSPPRRVEAPLELKPREQTEQDAAEIERATLREGVRKRIESARRKIASQDFAAARREIGTLHAVVDGRPRELEREKDSVRRLEESLASAVQAYEQAYERDKEARAWESQLQAARNALAQGSPSKARDLAQALLDTPGISSAVASDARSLIEQSRELEPAPRREARKLTITSVEINPQVIAPGGRVTAVAHAQFNPPLQQPMVVNLRARVMRSLGEIADPISQMVTIPAGGGAWIKIPIKIPKRVLAGDCYVDIELWDSTREMRGTGRIGFTIQ